MVRVVGVRFKTAGKVYYFDPAEFTIDMNDRVVVETARGVEYGEVAVGPRDVPEEQVVQPLKKVLRLGTEKDAQLAADNKRKEHDAYSIAQKKIEAHGLEMSLVDVEYTFDGSKIIFYFTAEGRVDFRELVRDLAGVFRTRIEMRQIGVRDEAKLLGGIGPCGRILCCTSFLGDFAPVSIRMAKDQNLSLNPSKISGLCGRLMCCLRYEQDTYEAAKKDPTLAPGYVPPIVMQETNVSELAELEDRPSPRKEIARTTESGFSARIAQAALERPRREDRPDERAPQAEGVPAGGGERRERPKQRPQQQQGQAPGQPRQGEPRRPEGKPQSERPQGGQAQQQGPGKDRQPRQPKGDGQRNGQGGRLQGERPQGERFQGRPPQAQGEPRRRDQDGRPQGQRPQGGPPRQQGGGSRPVGQGQAAQAPGPRPAALQSPGSQPLAPEAATGEGAERAGGGGHRRRRHRGRRHGGGGNGGAPGGGNDGGNSGGNSSAE